jgi:hypothetical protein
MMHDSWINKYKIFLFILVLIFSCIEDKSIVFNPEDGESYELRSFHLNNLNSSSFRPSDFNIGSSPRLYLGIDSYNNKSYIAIKIKNELLSDNAICNETNLNSISGISLKIPATGELDIFKEYYPDSSQVYDFDHDTFAGNLVKAYILDSDLSDELENVSEISTDDISNLDLSNSLPVTINNIFDYISIDLKSHVYSSYTTDIDDQVCDDLSYTNCLCNVYLDDNCLEFNNDCYWVGNPNGESGCMRNINTNLDLDIESWCNSESVHEDLNLLLEFIEPSAEVNLIELFSTESSNLYSSPYIFAKYNINDYTQEYKNKYDIDSISSSDLSNNFISNINSESSNMGTILGIDESIINIIDLNDSNSLNCIEDNTCELTSNTVISNSYNDILFNIDITLDEEYLDLYTDLSFYFNNIYFAYTDLDPSLDLWQDCGVDGNCDIVDDDGTQNNNLWDSGEKLESNNHWDWEDLNNNQTFDYLTDQYEMFDDFGTDNCSDENESSNNECLVDNSIYNLGLEGNNIWDHSLQGNDENGICDKFECELYDDYGFDESNNDYESGCISDDNPYGGKIDLSLGLTFSDIYADYGQDISSLDTYTHSSGQTICGQIHWENQCSKNSNNIINCRELDPNGDDYNKDPSIDDWHDCGTDADCSSIDMDGSQDNDLWDIGEGTEGNNQYDIGEKFFDYGVDGLPDIYEIFDYQTDDDNWFDCNVDQTICSNDEGWTDNMGNGIWDLGEGTQGNNIWEQGEPYFDYGSDKKQSYQEDNFNSSGKESNMQYDFFSLDYRENFFDYGLDHCLNENELGEDDCCDIEEDCNGELSEFEDPNQDNYLIDPNSDNYDIDDDDPGTENNGQLDWSDCNIDQTICSNDEAWDSDIMGNGIWDLGEGEQWYDYGYDGISNDEEPNYLNNSADLSLGTNLYMFELPQNSFDSNNDLQSFTFNSPSFSTTDQVGLWISSIDRIGENSYRLYINVNALVDIKAFQFQLKHIPYTTEIEAVIDRSLYLFSPEFNDDNNNNFPESSEIIEDGEKYILDSSIYLLPSVGMNDEDYNQQDLNISYGYGIESTLDFSTLDEFDEVYTLQSFIDENQNSNISNEFTNLVLYFDKTDNSKHDVEENSNIVIKYFDSESGQNVLFDKISAKTVSSDIDSIKINIGSLIQKYINKEINYNNIILSSNGEMFNFSNISIIYNGDDKSLNPRIDLFYSQ